MPITVVCLGKELATSNILVNCITPAAARTLNVTMLVEGTVQRARERLRVSVRLVNVGNDSTVWASTFDGSTTDALALQDSTVRAVAAAVAATGPSGPR